jgi:hypothetical protein
MGGVNAASSPLFSSRPVKVCAIVRTDGTYYRLNPGSTRAGIAVTKGSGLCAIAARIRAAHERILEITSESKFFL